MRDCVSEWICQSRPGSLRVRAEAKETVEHGASYTRTTDFVCCLRGTAEAEETVECGAYNTT